MSQEVRLDGRVAIVTGAGAGLGRAHALALAERGAAVVVNDVGGSVGGEGASDAAGSVVEEIKARGGTAVANLDSVAVRAGGYAIVEQAVSELGRIDIVVANAGIQRNARYEDFVEQDMHDMLDVHLKGSFWVTQAAYRHMKAQEYGRVIFTTSGSGLFGRTFSPGYCSAKGGIMGLMHTLALEGESHNVRTNAVAPIAYTRMTSPMFGPDYAERMPAEEVSQVVVYLASESCMINHEIIEAGVHRFARVFVGRTAGWYKESVTAEDIAEHLDEIRDLSQFSVPLSAQEDLSSLLGEQAPQVTQ